MTERARLDQAEGRNGIAVEHNDSAAKRKQQMDWHDPGQDGVTYGHQVTLGTVGYEFDSIVYFAADEQFNRNVLGRHGWLDRVMPGLIDYEGKLLLNRYSL